MHKNIILMLPPHSYDYDNWKLPNTRVTRIPPVGLIGLASHLHAQGCNVEFWDGRREIYHHKTNDFISLAENAVLSKKPDIVGINCTTALFDAAKAIAGAVRRAHPTAFIIAGGPHPSIEPQLTLKQIPELDAVGIGPGEELCLALCEGQAPETIAGLMTRERPGHYRPCDVNRDIDVYPHPNYALTDVDFYTGPSTTTTFGWLTRSLSMLTSRSCPWSCKFCASDWSKPFRMHSAEYVMDAVRDLSQYPIDTINFWDDTIAVKKQRLIRMCELFRQSKLFRPYGKIGWRASLRANQVEGDLLTAMREAGCYQISFGIESASNRLLQHMNKKSTVELNREACKSIVDHGFDLGGSVIMGLPSETESELEETFAFINWLKNDLGVHNLGIGHFRPLPGSPYYRMFVEQGLISPDKMHEIDSEMGVSGWANLGDFGAPPKHVFADIPSPRLVELGRMGSRLVYRRQPVKVFSDVAASMPEEAAEAASLTELHIIEAERSPDKLCPPIAA